MQTNNMKFCTLTNLFDISTKNFRRVVYPTYLILEEAYITFLNCYHKTHHSSYILLDFNVHNYTKYKFKHTLHFQGTLIEKNSTHPQDFVAPHIIIEEGWIFRRKSLRK